MFSSDLARARRVSGGCASRKLPARGSLRQALGLGDTRAARSGIRSSSPAAKETLTEQTKELSALGQKIAGESAEPITRGVNQAFNQKSLLIALSVKGDHISPLYSYWGDQFHFCKKVH
jgi:hypothetical protein